MCRRRLKWITRLGFSVRLSLTLKQLSVVNLTREGRRVLVSGLHKLLPLFIPATLHHVPATHTHVVSGGSVYCVSFQHFHSAFSSGSHSVWFPVTSHTEHTGARPSQTVKQTLALIFSQCVSKVKFSDLI